MTNLLDERQHQTIDWHRGTEWCHGEHVITRREGFLRAFLGGHEIDGGQCPRASLRRALQQQLVVQCHCRFLGWITAFELVVVTGNRVRRLLARASDEI
jgi:hypothetical protein